MAHQLPRDAGRVSSTQTFLPDLRDHHVLVQADILSRQGLRPGEADMESLAQEVDPFATRQTSHCPLWLSLTNPALLGLDAVVYTWQRLHLYAFPRSLCLQEF